MLSNRFVKGLQGRFMKKRIKHIIYKGVIWFSMKRELLKTKCNVYNISLYIMDNGLALQPLLKHCSAFDVIHTLTNGFVQRLQNRSSKRRINKLFASA